MAVWRKASGRHCWKEVIFDEQGQLLTGTMMDYAMPRADNFPPFTIDKTVTETTLNPLGAKGIGEAATIGSTPAVVNAVVDALAPYGVSHLGHAAYAAPNLGSHASGPISAMSTRYSLERDLDELERMAERLHEYLLGDVLYLSIGAGFIRGDSMPQLTSGALLLRRRRLTSLRPRLDSKQTARLGASFWHNMMMCSVSGLCTTRRN